MVVVKEASGRFGGVVQRLGASLLVQRTLE